MPMKPGRKPEVISSNIREMVRAGHKPKMAIAAALSHARKTAMADGGMVMDGDYDLDEEHERGLTDLMIQGDQPPVANPQTEHMEKSLAMKLHKADEDEEYYAMGGLVQGGPSDDEPVGNKPEEDMSSMTEEPLPEERKPAALGHSVIDGVPQGKGLSEEAMKALEAKKKMRRFRQ